MRKCITILINQSENINVNFLRNVFIQHFHDYISIHPALRNYETGLSPIGISYPDYQIADRKRGFLGERIRIIADEKYLKILDVEQMLKKDADYFYFTTIQNIPEKYTIVGYENVRGSRGVDCRLRRFLKRHPEATDEDVRNLVDFEINKSKTNRHLPFIQLKSNSSKNGPTPYRFYLKEKKYESMPDSPMYNTYGFNQVVGIEKF